MQGIKYFNAGRRDIYSVPTPQTPRSSVIVSSCHNLHFTQSLSMTCCTDSILYSHAHTHIHTHLYSLTYTITRPRARVSSGQWCLLLSSCLVLPSLRLLASFRVTASLHHYITPSLHHYITADSRNMKAFHHSSTESIASTAMNSLISSNSINAGTSATASKPRKSATYVQPKRKKKSSKHLTAIRTEAEQMNITHRPLVPPATTRKYKDTATRIQRRSQSRKRDSLLTMLRGFTAKQRVYVMTTTDGMRF
jgi:hypothetical protein